MLKSKLNGKNKIKAINTWAVAVLRYGAGIIKWTESELKDREPEDSRDDDSPWYFSS